MKVLIVEDEVIAQEMLKEFLDPHGASCDVAGNGLQAVAAFGRAQAEGAPYDLILLDIMMPEMDGQQALREIRRLEAEQGIGGTDMVKIVMVTALSDAKNVMEAFVKGPCEDYLTKPVYPDQLDKVLMKFGLLPAAPPPA